MQKVLLTTYRTLLRMSARVDKSPGMRSMLSCAPQRAYNHRRGEWAPINVAKLSSWPEPRVFLDNLIRRLNAGRQFYVPATMPEEMARADATMHELRAELERRQKAGAEAAATHSGASDPTATSAPGSASSSDGASAERPSSPSAALVPLCVQPYASLRTTLRQLFTNTSFSMGNLNNAFAAVKELSYVCDTTEKHRAIAVTLPPVLAEQPLPRMTRALTVDPLHHVQLIRGLTEEMLDHLGMPRRDVGSRSPSATDDSDGEGAEAAAADVPRNAFDRSEEIGGRAEAGDAETVSSPSAASATELKSAAAADTPAHVQLLLSHPQLSGFFRHSVLLLVRHAGNESAAFILNKPLENDERLRMPVDATLRLHNVHPIFSKHLRHHTVMVGGPVMSGGAFDESVFLLHAVPGIPSALPLADGLWLDGDLDALSDALDSGAASASSIVVVCGFSGWGLHQLKGELEAGTWLVASGDASDKAVAAFAMKLAHVSGAHAAPGDEPSASGAPTEPQAEANPMRQSVGIYASHRSTASWLWAYSALGEPLADLTTNQKPEVNGETPQ